MKLKTGLVLGTRRPTRRSRKLSKKVRREGRREGQREGRALRQTAEGPGFRPTSGESLCLYLPGRDSLCFRTFLEHLGEAYAEHHL